MEAIDTKFSLEDISPDWPVEKAKHARDLCTAFLNAPAKNRFLFGRNVYTTAVLERLKVAGVIDDFTDETSINGIPIIRMDGLPKDAFVLALSGGRPLTVRRLLEEKGVQYIDYFSLLKWGNLDLPEAIFNEGFSDNIVKNVSEVAWLYDLLSDEISRSTLRKLFKFRHSYDLDSLDGFTDREKEQYFDPILDIKEDSPVFLDVGGFDGFTTQEFIRRYPKFKASYVFEPEPDNFQVCIDAKAQHENVTVFPFGASDENRKIRFTADGSASRISDDGDMTLEVRRIDDVIDTDVTFIKMDIEGAEQQAIRGAKATIAKHRPHMAISVYHRPSDFWEIPKLVLSISPNYKVYLRHYTESIYETIMYFVPHDFSDLS
ncbi:FkbM family methyltransferase [Gymnodinialimonas sp. 2305UL16-5]|uniref:FkbM family methyltransferase n=1 Tax=Gymnodinialimonas mytili TaxID=3126503 RepID=UPI00309ECE68